MADYFLPLDATRFETCTRPALAACWRARSFDVARTLWMDLLPAAAAYSERYHIGPGAFLVVEAANGLPFDRACWRTLVGEVLLLQAFEIPEFPTAPETLGLLLAPGHYHKDVHDHSLLPPIQQAHRGSRDLTFGSAVYRPEYAGFNNVHDVARLAHYLASVRPETWTVAQLDGLPGVLTEEERAEELELARQWFTPLVEFYHRAQEAGQVVVVENVY
jgi:hypothetical protein